MLRKERKENLVDIKSYALNSTPQMEEQINEIANSKAFKNDKIRIMPDGHAGKDNEFYFAPRMNKVTAGTTIYIDGTTCDVDYESRMIKDPNKIIESDYKHPLDIVMGVNHDYLVAIATLGKAVKADKCGSNCTTDIDWTQKVLHAHINAGCNGYFDVVVMPCVDRNKAKNE